MAKYLNDVMQEPVGNLRLLQVFVAGLLCDCGCLGHAAFLFGDDERTGFALTLACAEKRTDLTPWRELAEKVGTLPIGEDLEVRLPSWKKGSIAEFSNDVATLLAEHMGVKRHFLCHPYGDLVARIFIPKPLPQNQQRNPATSYAHR